MKNSARTLYQARINEKCVSEFNLAIHEANEKTPQWGYNWRKFRSCSAEILKLDNYILLRSYRTIVACININTLEGFDLLRCEYGYTSTSAQNISKFFHDFDVRERYRWEYVG